MLLLAYLAETIGILNLGQLKVVDILNNAWFHSYVTRLLGTSLGPRCTSKYLDGEPKCIRRPLKH